MKLLTREHFVHICTQAILSTRRKITINNQLSGYKRYHREIKENDYFSRNVRTHLFKTRHNEYKYRHDFLKHVGLGNCHELADFLIVKIGKEIKRNHAVAQMKIVRSMRCDHTYLKIKIPLKGENDYSIWEVDAWDPRIIDISTRPDGTIKNYEFLDYGYLTTVNNSIYSDQINYKKKYTFFSGIAKPIPGSSNENRTPEREILYKHNHIYDNYTIEEAIKHQKIAPSGTLRYLQQPSGWQL